MKSSEGDVEMRRTWVEHRNGEGYKTVKSQHKKE
jgi:hypothetical protein